VFDPTEVFTTHQNIFSAEYLEYIESIDPDIVSAIGYYRMAVLNVLRQDNDTIANVAGFPSVINMLIDGGGAGGMGIMGMGLSSFPVSTGDRGSYLERNYELLHGTHPTKPTDLALVIGRGGRLDKKTLDSLGFDTGRENISFEEFLETEFMLIPNNAFWQLNEQSPDAPPEPTPEEIGAAFQSLLEEQPELMATLTFNPQEAENFPLIIAFLEEHDAMPVPPEPEDDGNPRFIATQGNDLEAMWNADGSIPLRITGVFRPSEARSISVISNGVVYSDALLQLVINDSLDSDVVKAVKDENKDVSFTDVRFSATMMSFLNPDEDIQNEMIIQALGGAWTPIGITIYPDNFESKNALLEFLDAWNSDDRDEKYHVFYTDMAGGLLGFMSEITHAIAIVLIAFASISLIVSLIMISIITYISVLERTKEIGILRALGARKKDITRVFNAETFIIGAVSGIIGVLTAWGLTFPANMIIEDLTNLPDVAQLNILHVVGLLVLSTTLTVLGGSIPAKIASKRDAVEALRSE
jgi:hypothetical protein